MSKKILFVFGTRPEAIKMAPVINELRKFPEYFDVKVCITAQHREMLDQVLDWFDISVDYDLDIMKPGQDLYDITSNVMLRIRDVYKQVSPDIVLVQGDTTTVMAAAIAAFYQKIDVGHIEAGLRTDNIINPFPEEFNRKVASIATKYHFAPTLSAKNNLLRENVSKNDISVTGNTIIDALKYSVSKLEKIDKHYLDEKIDFSKKVILLTAHRRESFGEGIQNICTAVKEAAVNYPEVEFVYPVHLNPNIREPVKEILGDIVNVKLIEPLNYKDFVYLMKKSYFILTDSGGVQEEAPSLGKPVLVMRENTERPEAVEAGTVRLVGTDRAEILKNVSLLLDKVSEYRKMSNAVNPYGDGMAASRIRKAILKEEFEEYV